MIRKLLAVIMLLTFAAQASAGVVYQVSFDSAGSSLSTNSNLTVGGSQLFNVYFHEKFDGNGSFTPRIDLAGGTNGLTTANFGVNRTSGSTTDITGGNGNASFDIAPPTVTFSASSATVEQEALTGPVFATSSAPDRRTVLLGAIQVTANSFGSTTFSLADFLAGSDDFIIDDGIGGLLFAADGGITFGTLTITAVPEPSSLMLVGVVGFMAALRRRRATKLN